MCKYVLPRTQCLNIPKRAIAETCTSSGFLSRYGTDRVHKLCTQYQHNTCGVYHNMSCVCMKLVISIELNPRSLHCSNVSLEHMDSFLFVTTMHCSYNVCVHTLLLMYTESMICWMTIW